MPPIALATVWSNCVALLLEVVFRLAPKATDNVRDEESKDRIIV